MSLATYTRYEFTLETITTAEKEIADIRSALDSIALKNPEVRDALWDLTTKLAHKEGYISFVRSKLENWHSKELIDNK